MVHLRKINCLFYKPTHDDFWMNRLVAWAKGPFCHVELCFEDGMATSIMNGESVFFHEKRYSNLNYTIVTITLKPDNYNRIYSFCQQATQKRVGFSMLSMTLSVLPWQIVPKQTDHTFCSRYVTEALQSGACEMVKDLNPMLVSPTLLYHCLKKNECNLIDTVPARLKAKLVVS